MPSPFRIPVLLAGTALLSACSVSNDYANFDRPAPPVTATLPSGGDYAPLPDVAETGLPWRQWIRDPRLLQLAEAALVDNRDLATSVAQIDVARAQYRIQRSAQLPTIAAGAGATFTDSGTARFGGSSSVDVGDSGSGVPSGFSSGGGGVTESYSVDAGVSDFELDLFGRVRSQSRAALERYLSTVEGARSARIALVAELASAWATHAADAELLKISEDTLASANRSIDLVTKLKDAGLISALDLVSLQDLAAAARADIAARRSQLLQDRNAIHLLVGRPVDPALFPSSLADADGALAAVPVALSSEVLLARPDVVAAERELKATNADVDAARAAFFPRISLTAALGLASAALGDLFTGGAFNWTVAPSATLPIFGGPTRGNLDLAKAQRQLALAQYEGAIQTAFRDVADALARRGTIDEQLAANRDRVAAAQRGVRLSDARYRAGLDNYLATLTAQRTLYTARQAAAAAQLEALANNVAVYRAIGNDGMADAPASVTPQRPVPSLVEPQEAPSLSGR